MSVPSDGGPAFPGYEQDDNRNLCATRGMSLRDYFASNAPPSPEEWMSWDLRPDSPPIVPMPTGFQHLPEGEYRVAVEDTMAKQREINREYANKLAAWRLAREVAWRYAYADAMIAESHGG